MWSTRPLSQFFKPLLAHTRSQGRCWAAIQLSHHPELPVCAVYGEINGLDIQVQHGWRFVLLCHTHRPQTGPYSVCVSRVELSDTGVDVVKQNPCFYWKIIPGGWVLMSGIKYSPTVLSNHSFNWRSTQSASIIVVRWAVVWQVQMGVSIWDAVHSHSQDRWVLSGADVQAPWHGVLETVRLLFWWSSAGWMPLRIKSLSAGVGHKDPVTILASLIARSMKWVEPVVYWWQSTSSAMTLTLVQVSFHHRGLHAWV